MKVKAGIQYIYIWNFDVYQIKTKLKIKWNITSLRRNFLYFEGDVYLFPKEAELKVWYFRESANNSKVHVKYLH